VLLYLAVTIYENVHHAVDILINLQHLPSCEELPALPKRMQKWRENIIVRNGKQHAFVSERERKEEGK
jgi:hypothetical protein